MAVLNYTVQSGDDFYSLSSTLYNDFALGFQDLIALNGIVPSQPLPAVIQYTQGLTRIIPSYVLPMQNNPAQNYIIRDGQTIYDLAIQLFGSLTGISNLLNLIPNLGINFLAGSILQYPEDLKADNYLFLNTIVATGINVNTPYGNNGWILQETGFRITVEDLSGSILIDG